jgi:hypothetical protein
MLQLTLALANVDAFCHGCSECTGGCTSCSAGKEAIDLSLFCPGDFDNDTARCE